MEISHFRCDSAKTIEERCCRVSNNCVNILITLVYFLSFPILCLKGHSQETKWFECVYFNTAVKIDYLYDPYLQLEKRTSKSRLLISMDDTGISIYERNGKSSFYMDKIVRYKMENGKEMRLFTGTSIERQKYLLGITSPIGFNRNLYDTAIIIETLNKANLYGVRLIYKIKTNAQIIDDKLSLKIDSAIVIKTNHVESIKVSKFIINNGKRLIVDEKYLDLEIIRGDGNLRHYVIINNGAEMMVKEEQERYVISVFNSNGSITRLYGRK